MPEHENQMLTLTGFYFLKKLYPLKEHYKINMTILLGISRQLHNAVHHITYLSQGQF